MKSKAILGLLALFVAILGFSSATYAAIDLNQGAEVQVGEAKNLPEHCDTSKVSGGVASWLANKGKDGADCFDYAVEQRCGYLNVRITKQPMPLYAQGPFRAVYTLNGQVASPYTNFPAVFAEDFNGGSVDVTWFTVGPEKDWLFDTDFPNFWSNVGQTITVDTDCEDAEEDDDQAEDVKPVGGSGGATPATTESTISTLPYTSGSITPAVAVGVLSILGLVVAAAGSIKSRMLVS